MVDDDTLPTDRRQKVTDEQILAAHQIANGIVALRIGHLDAYQTSILQAMAENVECLTDTTVTP